MNESESVNFSQQSMAEEIVRVPNDGDLAVTDTADEVIVEEHQVAFKPMRKSAIATPVKLNTSTANTPRTT